MAHDCTRAADRARIPDASSPTTAAGNASSRGPATSSCARRAKCGTTWMQAIVATLSSTAPRPGRVLEVAPWIDGRYEPIDAMVDRSTRRRIAVRSSRTPTPTAFPGTRRVSYIVVGRDGRDAFMSFHNHMRNMRPEFMMELAVTARTTASTSTTHSAAGRRHPRVLRVVARRNPMWFEHVASFWPHLGEPNVLFVHYNDLLADLDGQMRGVAEFLGIDVDENRWPDLVERCTFAAMKRPRRRARRLQHQLRRGRGDVPVRGSNARWRDVLTPAELAAFEQRSAELLGRKPSLDDVGRDHADAEATSPEVDAPQDLGPVQRRAAGRSVCRMSVASSAPRRVGVMPTIAAPDTAPGTQPQAELGHVLEEEPDVERALAAATTTPAQPVFPADAVACSSHVQRACLEQQRRVRVTLPPTDQRRRRSRRRRRSLGEVQQGPGQAVEVERAASRRRGRRRAGASPRRRSRPRTSRRGPARRRRRRRRSAPRTGGASAAGTARALPRNRTITGSVCRKLTRCRRSTARSMTRPTSTSRSRGPLSSASATSSAACTFSRSTSATAMTISSLVLNWW